jgi:SAM-dependent methyltransferase
MIEADRHDAWSVGAAYEPYAGRWSRLVAREFLAWLALPPGGIWLDVGCGTGALTETILERASPVEVWGVDPSKGFVDYARRHGRDRRASFLVGEARALPLGTATCDAVVSGLVLNLVPSPAAMVAEMARVARAGGVVGAYVWDYAGDMQLMRRFWDAAAALDRAALPLDEGRRFPICAPSPLADLFRGTGLEEVEVRAIDVPTVFRDFDDLWSPFLGGQGPAPGYVVALDPARRDALRERLRAALPAKPDGSIHLRARAWAARGRPLRD